MSATLSSESNRFASPPLPAGQALVGAGRWVSRRNCSIAPRHLLGVYLALAAGSVVIALGFWLHGAPLVLPFAGIELALVGVALLVWARHAGDREEIAFEGPRIHVACTFAERTERADFSVGSVRIAAASREPGALIEFRADDGAAICVGRFVRPEQLPRLAAELKAALALSRAGDFGVRPDTQTDRPR